ncbi:MAG TPA: 5'-3' exonuclease H3TH domain-containing protein [Candidatus Krumholzibacteria bacterium]|nr:5'-3' exonuclease H3TH domain-containing protein [Candidatus Krumholzibacteria bacterium]
MEVHLIDGTYELYRHYYALPGRQDEDGQEVAAMLGVMNSVLGMIKAGATHVGVATDHVIESFRNTMYPGYKTGEGIEPALWRQFHPLEEALRAMGVVVWAMVDQEADDALAAAAACAASDKKVTRVLICTPDKDLSQCVQGTRVVQLDRRSGTVRDANGVREKFGVGPESIPDYLALVGDSADGFPGISGWGPKSAATVLARHGHLEKIPDNPAQWDVTLRNAATLSVALRQHWSDALLFRDLATLRTDAPVFKTVSDLEWKAPAADFERLCEKLRAPDTARTAGELAKARQR